MQLSDLANNPKVKIGVKQTIKALSRKSAICVFIAEDAEQHVTRHVIDLATRADVEVIYVTYKKDLGKACNIDVGAATAVIEK